MRAGNVRTAAARVALLLALTTVAARVDAQESAPSSRDVYTGTFSIAAIDRETGEMGLAVTSRVPCVGNLVPHVRLGVGVVATQALVRLENGTEILDLMAQGVAPAEALRDVLARDPDAAQRQIAVIAPGGRSAQHTGGAAMPWAGQRAGPDYVTQGNVLAGPEVLAAVARSFEQSAGTGRQLGERLIEAITAGDRAGGDRRRGALESASVIVTDPRPGRAGRADGIAIDIDICESAQPVSELRRTYDAVVGNLGYRTLQQHHGPDVVQLKVMLHALGYFRRGEPEVRMELSAPFFNQEVVTAVNAFRSAHGLSGPADGSPPGLVDEETIEIMWRELEKRGLAAQVRQKLRELPRRP